MAASVVTASANQATFAAGATSHVLAYTQNVVAGNILVVAAAQKAAVTLSTPTDTQGNVYSQVVTPLSASAGSYGVWAAVALSSGANTVTFGGGTAGAIWQLQVLELTGVASATADASAVKAASTGTTCAVGPTGTTTQASEIALGIFFDQNITSSNTITKPTAFTSIQSQDTTSGHSNASFLVLSALQTVSGTWSFSASSTAMDGIIATFKSAGASTPVSLAAALTSSGDTINSTIRPLTAALSWLGHTKNQTVRLLPGILPALGHTDQVTGRKLAAILSVAGSIATMRGTAQVLAAGMAFLGTPTRIATRTITGALPVSGTALHSSGRRLGAALAQSAALVHVVNRLLTGSLPSSSTLLRAMGHGAGALLTGSGSTPHLIGRLLPGALPWSGGIQRQSSRITAAIWAGGGAVILAGSLALAGALGGVGSLLSATAKQLTATWNGIGVPTVTLDKLLGGLLLPAGAAGHMTTKLLAGICSATGITPHLIGRILGAHWSGSGLLATVRQAGMTAYSYLASGTLTVRGDMGQHSSRIIAALLLPMGTVARSASHMIQSLITIGGTATRTMGKTVDATLPLVGVMTSSRLYHLLVAGSLPFQGVIQRARTLFIGAMLILPGAVNRLMVRPLSASLQTTGGLKSTIALLRQFIERLLGPLRRTDPLVLRLDAPQVSLHANTPFMGDTNEPGPPAIFIRF